MVEGVGVGVIAIIETKGPRGVGSCGKGHKDHDNRRT